MARTSSKKKAIKKDKKRSTPKQKAFKRLERRIKERIKQGYRLTSTFDYNKMTEEEINKIRYSELDKYFQAVTEYGEILAPKEARKYKREYEENVSRETLEQETLEEQELGYETIPQESNIHRTVYTVIDDIENLIATIPYATEVMVRVGDKKVPKMIDTSGTSEMLTNYLYDQVNQAEQDGKIDSYADHLLRFQEQISEALTIFNRDSKAEEEVYIKVSIVLKLLTYSDFDNAEINKMVTESLNNS